MPSNKQTNNWANYCPKSIITTSMKALVISLFLQTNGVEALRTQAGVMRVDLERQLVQRPEMSSFEDEE